VFGVLKDTTLFIHDHWKAMAVLLGSMKLASWTMNSGAATGGLVSILGSLSPAAGAAAGGLSRFAGQLGVAVGGLGALYLSAQALAKYIDEKQSGGLAAQAAAPRAMTALTAGAKAMSSAMREDSDETTMGHLQTAFAAYGLKPGQTLSRETLAAELKAMEPGLAAAQLGQYGIRGMSAKTMGAPGVIDEAAGRVANLLNKFASDLLAANPALGKGTSPHVTKQERNTNIYGGVHLTQEFKEADPDRVFHKVINEIDHAVNAPRGAVTNALGA
jgi:hypothetical protein